ncbi:MAG: SpoIVB peptidase [Candidatus Syntrophonatronum acetioxidans]|uniref:SpoIVB peptidase n=1 Tax=Candidatus Syntrophonatronum acetioxidans TaxID=1795816 RepID=A0A424YFA5_9FIRM|nr:MAG: SpoIVB peptidase [Candidatus Syntrophonatronum acetioxidans]
MKLLRSHAKVLLVLFLALLLVPVFYGVNYSQNISLIQGEEHYVNFTFPLKAEITCDQSNIIKINGDSLEDTSTTVSLKDPLSLKAVNLGNARLDIKLFGVIPLRHLTVNVFPEKLVYPGGQSIGIKLRSEGVIVVGFNKVDGNYPAREMGLKKGDSIIAINGNKVDSIDEAAELINEKGSFGEPVDFNIKRGENLLRERITPRYCPDTSSFRIGLYIRDTAAGVGTLSFYDPDSKLYGALGHVIVDIDTNTPININQGEIVKASIVRIKEGKRGHPGEKTGVFIEKKDIIGTIDKNTEYGIFGKLEKINNKNDYYSEPIPVALNSQVQVGPAEILTVLNGDKIEKFDVEIQRIVNPNTPSNKGFIIKITDEDLINRTGGIIQGMSGSPIIQNNKLAGAVTHVFINDPTRGYGIFVEWMLQESGALDTKYVN